MSWNRWTKSKVMPRYLLRAPLVEMPRAYHWLPRAVCKRMITTLQINRAQWSRALVLRWDSHREPEDQIMQLVRHNRTRCRSGDKQELVAIPMCQTNRPQPDLESLLWVQIVSSCIQVSVDKLQTVMPEAVQEPFIRPTLSSSSEVEIVI